MTGPDPYAPCTCGSGKKYKFCCRGKDKPSGGSVGLAIARRHVPDVSSVATRSADERWFKAPFALCAVQGDFRGFGQTPMVFARRVEGTLFAHFFLVDVFGIGLKDCFPSRAIPEADFNELILARTFPSGHATWTEEQGHAFVWQGAEFARQNGFRPPSNWRACALATGPEPDDLRVDPALFGGGRRGVHICGDWEDIRRRMVHPMSMEDAIAEWESHGYDFTLGSQHMPGFL